MATNGPGGGDAADQVEAGQAHAALRIDQHAVGGAGQEQLARRGLGQVGGDDLARAAQPPEAVAHLLDAAPTGGQAVDVQDHAPRDGLPSTVTACRRFPVGARVFCDGCGHDRLLAFSCKGALCPSCNARKMNDVAAHLVTRVLPDIPYRLWVLSLPRHVRFRLARDPALLSRVLTVFLRAVFCWQRRRARAAGVVRPLCGSITFVQRFGSLVNLNVHFHAVVPDGVFVAEEDGSVSFEPLDPPTDREVLRIAERIERRVTRHLDALDPDDDAPDALADAQSESVQAALPREPDEDEPVRPTPRCAFVRGFSLHANVAIDAEDRAGLERLCRYGARPPLALSRLSRAPDGDLLYRPKRRAPKGASVNLLRFSPLQLLGRLATLVPPPKRHGTHYHGVFASHSTWRRRIVPPAPPDSLPAHIPASPPPPASVLERRLPWADLLRRVYAVDVLRCDRCGGRMRVLAFIRTAAVVRRILEHLGLPAQPPRTAPARASPEPDDDPGWRDDDVDAAWDGPA